MLVSHQVAQQTAGRLHVWLPVSKAGMDIQSTIAAKTFTVQWNQTNQATLTGLSHTCLCGMIAEMEPSLQSQTWRAFTTRPCKCMDQQGPGKFVYGVKRPPSSNFRNKWQKIAQLHEVQTKATTLQSGKTDDRSPGRTAIGEHTSNRWAGHGAGSAQSSLLSHNLCNHSNCLRDCEQEDTQLVKAGRTFWNG